MPFIIYETTGYWALGLRPRLPDDISLIETRSLDEMWQRLQDVKSATVALELTTPRAEQVLAALLRLNREFPQVTVMVFAERSLAAWEEIVREAGAVHFTTSPRRLDEVVELARCHTAASSERRVPSDEEVVSLEDRILASLPWGQ
jgi:hypothetical protein